MRFRNECLSHDWARFLWGQFLRPVNIKTHNTRDDWFTVVLRTGFFRCLSLCPSLSRLPMYSPLSIWQPWQVFPNHLSGMNDASINLVNMLAGLLEKRLIYTKLFNLRWLKRWVDSMGLLGRHGRRGTSKRVEGEIGLSCWLRHSRAQIPAYAATWSGFTSLVYQLFLNQKEAEVLFSVINYALKGKFAHKVDFQVSALMLLLPSPPFFLSFSLNFF